MKCVSSVLASLNVEQQNYWKPLPVWCKQTQKKRSAALKDHLRWKAVILTRSAHVLHQTVAYWAIHGEEKGKKKTPFTISFSFGKTTRHLKWHHHVLAHFNQQCFVNQSLTFSRVKQSSAYVVSRRYGCPPPPNLSVSECFFPVSRGNTWQHGS